MGQYEELLVAMQTLERLVSAQRVPLRQLLSFKYNSNAYIVLEPKFSHKVVCGYITVKPYSYEPTNLVGKLLETVLTIKRLLNIDGILFATCLSLLDHSIMFIHHAYVRINSRNEISLHIPYKNGIQNRIMTLQVPQSYRIEYKNDTTGYTLSTNIEMKWFVFPLEYFNRKDGKENHYVCVNPSDVESACFPPQDDKQSLSRNDSTLWEISHVTNGNTRTITIKTYSQYKDMLVRMKFGIE